MGERGGVQHYLYWSDGRIRRFLEDQGIVISEQTQRKLSSPSFSGYAPTMEAVWTRFVPYKVELAKKVEVTLGRLAVSDFDSPAPIKFAHGSGTVTFGEFVTFDRDAEDDRGHPRKALMYTSVVTESGLRVGVCLFGSMHNYADYVLDAEDYSKKGWASSAAPEVARFLRNRCTKGDEHYSREDLAIAALQIAQHQGKMGGGSDHGWNRAFTFGDTRDVAEWLAEIYYDCDLRGTTAGLGYNIDRVLIGAPYWLRTPSLREVTLYSQASGGEIDTARVRERSRSRRSWMQWRGFYTR